MLTIGQKSTDSAQANATASFPRQVRQPRRLVPEVQPSVADSLWLGSLAHHPAQQAAVPPATPREAVLPYRDVIVFFSVL